MIGSWPSPTAQEVRAQRLGGEDVQGREWLVHEQDVGMHDKRARKADALAHAAGELARISGLETIQTDEVDGLQRPHPHLRFRSP